MNRQTRLEVNLVVAYFIVLESHTTVTDITSTQCTQQNKVHIKCMLYAGRGGAIFWKTETF